MKKQLSKLILIAALTALAQTSTADPLVLNYMSVNSSGNLQQNYTDINNYGRTYDTILKALNPEVQIEIAKLDSETQYSCLVEAPNYRCDQAHYNCLPTMKLLAVTSLTCVPHDISAQFFYHTAYPPSYTNLTGLTPSQVYLQVAGPVRKYSVGNGKYVLVKEDNTTSCISYPEDEALGVAPELFGCLVNRQNRFIGGTSCKPKKMQDDSYFSECLGRLN